MAKSTQFWGHSFFSRALSHRNYRLFFIGQGASLIGTWTQQVAMSWLVYRLTGSEFLLGLLGFCSQIFILLVTPFGGAMADKFPRRQVLMITQVLSMTQAVILALLVLTHHLQVWHLFALALTLGLINAIDVPFRQSFVADTVDDPKHYNNAIALNGSIFHGSRLIGPMFAGIIIAHFGEGICFLINALSFLAILVALALMDIQIQKKRETKTSLLNETLEGFYYVFDQILIFRVLIFLALLSLFVTSYITLLPVFSLNVFHGDSRTLGFLMSASGVGALLGSLFMANLKNTHRLPLIIKTAPFLLLSSLFLFGLSNQLSVSLIAIFFAAMGLTLTLSSSNTLLQTMVDPTKRGRVMGFFAMSNIGMAPIGNLWMGSLAQRFGAPHALLFSATIGLLVCLFFSLYFLKFEKLK